MRRNNSVRGAGRAQMANLIQMALRRAGKLRTADFIIRVPNPTSYSETFYKQVGFQDDTEEYPEIYITKGLGRSFLRQYQANPFFF